MGGWWPEQGAHAIHDYELEHSLIVKLAGAGLVQFSEPCVAGAAPSEHAHRRRVASGVQGRPSMEGQSRPIAIQTWRLLAYPHVTPPPPLSAPLAGASVAPLGMRHRTLSSVFALQDTRTECVS